MLCDAYPEYGHPFQTPQGSTLHMKVDDVEASWKRAVDAGCEIVLELQDMFWGDRYGQLRDPFGFLWSMGMPIKK
jgi:PhnB protein